MERLNLYDTLVRIPMMHGDLGKESKVGHTDNLCKRKMRTAPLSDFFAASHVDREEQVSQMTVEATLWMNDAPTSAGTSAMQSYLEIHYPEKEKCELSEEAIIRSDRSTENFQTEARRHEGMSPFDPTFMGMIGGFILLVTISSRIW